MLTCFSVGGRGPKFFSPRHCLGLLVPHLLSANSWLISAGSFLRSLPCEIVKRYLTGAPISSNSKSSIVNRQLQLQLTNSLINQLTQKNPWLLRSITLFYLTKYANTKGRNTSLNRTFVIPAKAGIQNKMSLRGLPFSPKQSQYCLAPKFIWGSIKKQILAQSGFCFLLAPCTAGGSPCPGTPSLACPACPP